MRFTPGPWEAKPWAYSNDWVVVNQDNDIVAITDIVNHEPEAEANAHLISAAPDMYKALSLAADYLHDLPNDEGDLEFNKVCKLVRKALAKAEGK